MCVSQAVTQQTYWTKPHSRETTDHLVPHRNAEGHNELPVLQSQWGLPLSIHPESHPTTAHTVWTRPPAAGSSACPDLRHRLRCGAACRPAPEVCRRTAPGAIPSGYGLVKKILTVSHSCVKRYWCRKFLWYFSRLSTDPPVFLSSNLRKQSHIRAGCEHSSHCASYCYITALASLLIVGIKH